MTGTNYQKLLNVITPELDELHVVYRDIKVAFQVMNARGQSLDNIGVLLDYERIVDFSDTAYREQLINVIYINAIAGTKDAIKKLLANYLQLSDSYVIIQETRPNYIVVWLPKECESKDKDLQKLVHRAVAAGVYVGFYYNINYWDVSEWDAENSIWG